MTILNTIPEKFVGPSAWVGTDLQSRQSEWLYTLTADDISEIEHAARHFLTLGRDVGEITARDFPLPQFSDHLQNMSEKLLRGIGVEVIRGLPIKSYSQEMAAAIFCGIGAHLGPARSQNAAGHILGLCAILVRTRMIQTRGFIKPAHGKVSIQTARMSSR